MIKKLGVTSIIFVQENPQETVFVGILVIVFLFQCVRICNFLLSKIIITVTKFNLLITHVNAMFT